MLDSFLVANEKVDYLKKEKKSGVFVKVDFEKTYDSVGWEFLYYITTTKNKNYRGNKYIGNTQNLSLN